jgi:hypothetical protein
MPPEPTLANLLSVAQPGFYIYCISYAVLDRIEEEEEKFRLMKMLLIMNFVS